MAFGPELREADIRRFLETAGWAQARRIPLGQDASTRRYERLQHGNDASAILMDAPPVEDAPCPPEASEAERLALGWNASTRLAASRVDAFVALAGELRGHGLSAPQILAHDADVGLALMEDFGHAREFARLIEAGMADETDLYRAAAAPLAALHRLPVPARAEGYGETWPILDFDAVALRANADLFAEWLPRFDARIALSDRSRARWEGVRDRLIERACGLPRAFTLRDYHAENLVWLPGRAGGARIGLLDFQDAVRGWAGWDLAMLTQDARRAVSPGARDAALTAYLDQTGGQRAALDEELAIIGALNALRITGLFARLIHRDGKPRYHAFMARQQGHLAHNLAHPALEEMSAFIGDVAPFILETAP